MTTVSVRPGRVEDLSPLTDIYNHYVVHSHATFDLEPVTLEERREWLAHYADTGPHRLLVAVDGGAVLGFATSSEYLTRRAYAASVITSVYCAPDAGGRGVGSALYTALFDALAAEDVHRAFAGVALPNPASLALHHRFEFRDIGTFSEAGRKFGRWWDVLWLERSL